MGTRLIGKCFCYLLVLLCGVAHANTVTYIYTDPQGTPLAEADANGNITATFDYAPYGSQALGTPPNGPGYTGHVNDPDTGLVYMQARYYDPATGRFLSVDPQQPIAGNTFSFARYAYGNNNPIRNIDPNGKFPEPPLFQVSITNQITTQAYHDEVAQPAANAIAAVDSKVNITYSGGATYKNFGAIAEGNVLHSDEAKLAPVYGEGANMSVDVSPKNSFTVNIFGGSSQPSSLSFAAEAEGGDVLHAGITASLDTNGNFTLTPKVGLGFGELVTLKTPVHVGITLAPAVTIKPKEQSTNNN